MCFSSFWCHKTPADRNPNSNNNNNTCLSHINVAGGRLKKKKKKVLILSFPSPPTVTAACPPSRSSSSRDPSCSARGRTSRWLRPPSLSPVPFPLPQHTRLSLARPLFRGTCDFHATQVPLLPPAPHSTIPLLNRDARQTSRRLIIDGRRPTSSCSSVTEALLPFGRCLERRRREGERKRELIKKNYKN